MESLLDRAREITLLSQIDDGSLGEGIDLGLAYVLLQMMREEARADRVEVVSGRNHTEVWKEVNAAGLPSMFKTFRTVFASQLCDRFHLDSTPDKHTLLALKMHPAINTALDSPQLLGKSAKAELMQAEYKRALRRQFKAKAAIMQQKTTVLIEDDDINQHELGEPSTPTSTRTPEAVAEPGPKRRKGLMGVMLASQSMQQPARTDDFHAEENTGEAEILGEIETFDLISQRILAAVREIPMCPMYVYSPMCFVLLTLFDFFVG